MRFVLILLTLLMAPFLAGCGDGSGADCLKDAAPGASCQPEGRLCFLSYATLACKGGKWECHDVFNNSSSPNPCESQPDMSIGDLGPGMTHD
jgi:hypothetical protein